MKFSQNKDYNSIRKAKKFFIDMNAFKFYIEKDGHHIYCIHDNNTDIFIKSKERFYYNYGVKRLPDFVYAFAFTDFPIEEMMEWLNLCNEIKEVEHEKPSISKWSEDELNILKKYYAYEGSAVYLRLKGRSRDSCRHMAHKIGLITKKYCS